MKFKHGVINMDVIDMEVKIKQGNEMLDATIEMVDGVMVVSPKVEKFEPKDGDVLSCFFYGKYQGTFVFEEASECGEAIFHVALDADGKFIKGGGCYYFGYIYDACPATEEEKQKLFDKLAEEGYEWKADTKELVKLKWKPKEGEQFWLPLYYTEPTTFSPISSLFSNGRDRMLLDKGWCFKTKEECQEFCGRLNEAINSVKQ
jgi:hypothetical protein